MRKVAVILLAVAATPSCLTKISAAVAYSNFGPGDGFYTQTGGVVAGTVYIPPETLAVQFQSQVTGTLTSVELAIALATAPIRTGEVSVMLQFNSPNTFPAITGFFLGIINAPATDAVVTFTPQMKVMLNAGEKYWLVLGPATNTTLVVWDATTLPGNYMQATSHGWGQVFLPDGGGCGGFRINAEPVLESRSVR